MRTIFAEYNPHRNSIDVYTSAGLYYKHVDTLMFIPMPVICSALTVGKLRRT